MESAIFAVLFFTSLLSTALSSDPCSADSSEISVIPIYGKCSPLNPSQQPSSSVLNTVMKMASKDPERMSYLSSLVAAPPAGKPKGASSVPIAPGQQVLNIGNYVLRAKIGTPGQLLFMVLDTSNDGAWVPCSGCVGCPASSAVFTPNASSSYALLDCSVPECTQVRGASCPTTGSATCSFNQTYGGDSSFSATLSHDTLQLGNDAIPNYAFGCINTASGGSMPPQGLLGMGQGSMSLLSQSGSLYSGVFSYCLPSFKSYYFSGSLKLGPVGQPKSIRTTPLLRNPHRPSLYYVNLTGVSIGKVQVPIAPQLLAFDPSTGAGTIIDSGTVITRFVQSAFQ